MNDLLSLLSTAVLFQIDDLVALVSDLVADTLSIETCCHVVEFSEYQTDLAYKPLKVANYRNEFRK
jgi:hypothetical protein